MILNGIQGRRETDRGDERIISNSKHNREQNMSMVTVFGEVWGGR